MICWFEYSTKAVEEFGQWRTNGIGHWLSQSGVLTHGPPFHDSGVAGSIQLSYSLVIFSDNSSRD
jgi:hypothetical protein